MKTTWKKIKGIECYFCRLYLLFSQNCFLDFLEKNILGDNVKWANQVSKCKSGSCDAWSHHSRHRRIQNRERFPDLPGLHPRECAASSRVRVLVPEWQNDQLWLKPWSHRHHHSGQENQLQIKYPEVSFLFWFSYFLYPSPNLALECKLKMLNNQGEAQIECPRISLEFCCEIWGKLEL